MSWPAPPVSRCSRIAGWRGGLAFALLVAAVLCCRVPEAVFSPDGEQVAYVLLARSGKASVRVGDIASGGSREVLRARADQGMLRPLYGDKGGLWVLAARDEPHGFEVYAIRDEVSELVLSVDGPEIDLGFLFPACVVGERWLWSTLLRESAGPEWQRLDLTTGEIDAPFGDLMVVRCEGPAGEFGLSYRDIEDAPEALSVVRLDLAVPALAELLVLDEAFVGAGREPATFSQLAVGSERLAFVLQSPESAWEAADAADVGVGDVDADVDVKTGEVAASAGAVEDADAGPEADPEVVEDEATDDDAFSAPRAAELVLLDLHGALLERRVLDGVRLVSGHALTGGDRWLWALAVVDSGELVLLRQDLRDGTRVQLSLAQVETNDIDELFFQARLASSPDGRRVSLLLLGEDVGSSTGRVLVFDAESDGPLEPRVRFDGDA